MVFSVFKDSVRRSVARVPAGRRVYAVGDIHGRMDLLDDVMMRIAEDDAARPKAETTIVFLGDLIDRGPDSADVVEQLRLLAQSPLDVRFLMGNHEEVFLDVLKGGTIATTRFFRRIGGDATILSYGMSEADYRGATSHDLRQFLIDTVPPEHVEFLSGFGNQVVVGDYAFVHAGIRPGVALSNQRVGDLRWIRDEFLAVTKPFEKMIVHGHTITEAIDEQPNRIGLDTGAFASGRLSAMGFENEQRWAISVVGAPGVPPPEWNRGADG